MRSLIAILLVTVALLAASQTARAQSSALKGHDTQAPFSTDSDDFEINERAGTAQLRGNVIIKQGKLTLRTESLVIYYNRESVGGDRAPEILRIDALSAVTITSPSETVTGEWGVFDVPNRLITLGGRVKLDRGEQKVEGGLLELNLETGVVKLDSNRLDGEAKQRVRGIFTAPPVRKRDDEGEG